MRRKQMNGAKDDPRVAQALETNQNGLVDALLEPRVRLPERGGGTYHIISKLPAINPEAQPTQARGRIVWNKAYLFQSRGPSYLDPIPDPSDDRDWDDV